jgi:DNA-binding transcriptional regulator YiaG
MSPRPKHADDFRALLERAKLSQMAAADALQVAPRTVRAWALGEREHPHSVTLALRWLAAHPQKDTRK